MQYRLPQQHYPEDPTLYATGDQRPNTGLREGLVQHSEVNDTIRMNTKTVIFGQQTRLRNGVMMPDEKLDRFHAGHDMVKFFYSAVRQLPSYLVDALLENNVSVTLSAGPVALGLPPFARAPVLPRRSHPPHHLYSRESLARSLRKRLRLLGHQRGPDPGGVAAIGLSR
ncbi:hypothetical protein OAF45_01820 [Candidatus Latescibacteria bacterium]|nr:hypothetical protein [Candidatus Latescibacterota bacterium]